MSRILGFQLPPEVEDQLRARESTLVLATINEDGSPNTMPVHILWAKDTGTIIMALRHDHRSLGNIRRDGKVMLSLCEKEDLNVSISGDARVVREPSRCNRKMVLVEVKVLEVKDDSTHSFTTCGIRYRCKTDAGVRFIRDLFDELEEY